jgi:hypothetical protein
VCDLGWIAQAPAQQEREAAQREESTPLILPMRPLAPPVAGGLGTIVTVTAVDGSLNRSGTASIVM